MKGQEVQVKVSRLDTARKRVSTMHAKKQKKAGTQQSDQELKILRMVRYTVGISAFVQLYLIYDIAGAVGRVRHITDPFCESKDVFVRLSSFVQIVIVCFLAYVFPVKRPELIKVEVTSGSSPPVLVRSLTSVVPTSLLR
jgi:hypothetical protein